MGLWILITIAASPLVLGVVFKVSTSHIFFALMTGELLGRYFGHELDKQAVITGLQERSHGAGEIVLILLPMFATAFFLRNTLSRGMVFLHIIPLAVTGIICAAFVVPVLPDLIKDSVATEAAGQWVLDMNRWIIGGMVSAQLVYLWVINRAGQGKHSE